MKFAFVSINGRNISGSNTITSCEIEGIANILNKVEPGCCKLLSFNNPEISLFCDSNEIYIKAADPKDFDAILVMNGTCNFFGGEPNYNVIEAYKFLAKSKTTPIFYIYDDTELSFVQCWDMVKRRKWNKWTEEELLVTAPFYVISQFKDVEKAIVQNSRYIKVCGGTYSDIGTWILDEPKFLKNEGKFDLIYGGNKRKRRQDKMKEFLTNHNLSTLVYGAIDKDFLGSDSVLYEGKVPSNQVVKKNTAGFATVLMGEPGYSNNVITLRTYESILAGTIVFVDEDYDKEHTIFSDYAYIKSGKELEEKVKELRNNENLYKEVLLDQKNFIKKKQEEKNIEKIYDYCLQIKESMI